MISVEINIVWVVVAVRCGARLAVYGISGVSCRYGTYIQLYKGIISECIEYNAKHSSQWSSIKRAKGLNTQYCICMCGSCAVDRRTS